MICVFDDMLKFDKLQLEINAGVINDFGCN